MVEKLIMLFVLIAMSFGIALWKGFVFAKTWTWFIVPMSPHVPLIGTIQAAAIFLIATLFSKVTSDNKDENKDWAAVGEMAGRGFILPAFALLFAWLLTLIA